MVTYLWFSSLNYDKLSVKSVCLHLAIDLENNSVVSWTGREDNNKRFFPGNDPPTRCQNIHLIWKNWYRIVFLYEWVVFHEYLFKIWIKLVHSLFFYGYPKMGVCSRPRTLAIFIWRALFTFNINFPSCRILPNFTLKSRENTLLNDLRPRSS